VAIIVTCDIGLKATKSCSIQRATITRNIATRQHCQPVMSGQCFVFLLFVHII